MPQLFGHALAQCLIPDANICSSYRRRGGARNCTDEEGARLQKLFNANIVDLVEVPANLLVGDVLSWRHDASKHRKFG